MNMVNHKQIYIFAFKNKFWQKCTFVRGSDDPQTNLHKHLPFPPGNWENNYKTLNKTINQYGWKKLILF